MVDKDAVRRAYDGLVETYAADRSEDGPDVAILEEGLETLPPSATVLDAGCGGGRPVLSRLCAETDAVGLDFSRGQLHLAAETAPGAALVQGDMTALPFSEGSFDAVVAYWSLIHVPMDDHGRAIDEFARVLRPGGRVLLCEGAEEWSGTNPDWLDSGVRMEWNIAGAKTTREQLRDAGFVVVDSWGAVDPLEEDGSDDGQDDDRGSNERGDDVAEDSPWTFFLARLGSEIT